MMRVRNCMWQCLIIYICLTDNCITVNIMIPHICITENNIVVQLMAIYLTSISIHLCNGILLIGNSRGSVSICYSRKSIGSGVSGRSLLNIKSGYRSKLTRIVIAMSASPSSLIVVLQTTSGSSTSVLVSNISATCTSIFRIVKAITPSMGESRMNRTRAIIVQINTTRAII